MKKIIPFGDKFLVRRKPAGDKMGSAGIIVRTEHDSAQSTDIAVILKTPEKPSYWVDVDDIKSRLLKSLMLHGESSAKTALDDIVEKERIYSLKAGDQVFISKYIGLDFNDNAGSGNLTLLKSDDIMAAVVDVGDTTNNKLVFDD